MIENTARVKERPTPQMDIYKLRDQMYKCTKREQSRAKCDSCSYYGSKNCQSRLMNEAAHAITLLLEEREGKPLVVYKS